MMPRMLLTICCAIAVVFFSCKPKNISDTKAITGLENGIEKAFGIIPVRLPITTVQKLYNMNEAPQSDTEELARWMTVQSWFALVECAKDPNNPDHQDVPLTSAQLMEILEFESSLSSGNVYIDDMRDLSVGVSQRQYTYVNKVCKLVDGSNLMPVQVIMAAGNENLDVPAQAPSGAELETFRQKFLAKQTIFLAMRGMYDKKGTGMGSLMIGRYQKMAKDHANIGLESTATQLGFMKNNDPIFNPCVPAPADRAWLQGIKESFFSCDWVVWGPGSDRESNRFAHYRIAGNYGSGRDSVRDVLNGYFNDQFAGLYKSTKPIEMLFAIILSGESWYGQKGAREELALAMTAAIKSDKYADFAKTFKGNSKTLPSLDGSSGSLSLLQTSQFDTGSTVTAPVTTPVQTTTTTSGSKVQSQSSYQTKVYHNTTPQGTVPTNVFGQKKTTVAGSGKSTNTEYLTHAALGNSSYNSGFNPKTTSTLETAQGTGVFNQNNVLKPTFNEGGVKVFETDAGATYIEGQHQGTGKAGTQVQIKDLHMQSPDGPIKVDRMIGDFGIQDTGKKTKAGESLFAGTGTTGDDFIYAIPSGQSIRIDGKYTGEGANKYHEVEDVKAARTQIDQFFHGLSDEDFKAAAPTALGTQNSLTEDGKSISLISDAYLAEQKLRQGKTKPVTPGTTEDKPTTNITPGLTAAEAEALKKAKGPQEKTEVFAAGVEPRLETLTASTPTLHDLTFQRELEDSERSQIAAGNVQRVGEGPYNGGLLEFEIGGEKVYGEDVARQRVEAHLEKSLPNYTQEDVDEMLDSVRSMETKQPTVTAFGQDNMGKALTEVQGMSKEIESMRGYLSQFDSTFEEQKSAMDPKSRQRAQWSKETMQQELWQYEQKRKELEQMLSARTASFNNPYQTAGEGANDEVITTKTRELFAIRDRITTASKHYQYYMDYNKYEGQRRGEPNPEWDSGRL